MASPGSIRMPENLTVSDRLYIGGHSSGGHLCGVALVTDWQKDFGLPANVVKGGLCISGMYDLKPVRLSKRSSYVKFTDEMEQAMSSQRHLDLLPAPSSLHMGPTSLRSSTSKPRFCCSSEGRRKAGRPCRGTELQSL